MTIQDKVAMMRQYVAEFAEVDPALAQHVHVIDELGDLERYARGDVVIAPAVSEWEGAASADISLFDLSTKEYLKQRSPAEVALLHFLVGYRARFIPRDA